MQLVRFAVVGVTVALFYIGLYLGLLSLGLSQFPANAIAFLTAIALQYIGQAGFTFRKRLDDPRQMLRFGSMIGMGLVTASLITALIAHRVGLSDLYAAALVAVILPIQNYLFMSLWVFVDHQSSEDSMQ